MLGRFRSAIYSAIGTEIEPGTPAVPGGVSSSADVGRVGKVGKDIDKCKSFIRKYRGSAWEPKKVISSILYILVWSKRPRWYFKRQQSKICLPKTSFSATIH